MAARLVAADDMAVFGKNQRRRAIIGKCVKMAFEVRNICAELFEERGAARRVHMTVCLRRDAFAERRGKRGHGERRNALLFRFLDDRRRERMLALLLEPCRDGEQTLFIDADRCHARDTRPALGDRARLVHDDGIDGLCRFERLARFDEDAVFRALARADHDGDRRRKAERAGA